MKNKKCFEGDGGFTSIAFMLMMLVLIVAVGAISVDLWHLVAQHRELAGVVDGAAISAASAVDLEALRRDPRVVQIQPDRAVARACSYLQDHGAGPCPGSDAEITVDGDTVSITMRRKVRLTLLRVLSGLSSGADTSPIEVTVSSTASIASR
jgi:hypothetical protein